MSIIDHSRLESLKSVTGESFRPIISTYVEDTGSKLCLIKSALQTHDTGLISELLHSIKGSSINVGATMMASLCENYESRLSLDDQGYIRDMLISLEQTFQNTQAQLRKISSEML